LDALDGSVIATVGQHRVAAQPILRLPVHTLGALKPGRCLVGRDHIDMNPVSRLPCIWQIFATVCKYR
jgi:hypothetical protein